MYEKLEAIEQEIGKVIKGKKDVIRKVLMAICASGHVLLEDHPGSGKTTLAKAIAKAMSMAQAGDVIVIAGKGDEDYQEICGVKHHFSDRETVEGLLETKDFNSQEN